MLLGALVDAGAPLAEVAATLHSLGIEGWELVATPDRRGAIAGTRLEVRIDPALEQPHRRLGDIASLLDRPALPMRVRRDALAVFQALAEAEGRVHRVRPEEVHFHEVGALDSIIDIVGTVVALELLSIERVSVSAVPLGGGFARSAHGTIPIPAPATVELLAQAKAPVRPSVGTAANVEMVTPTAAAFFAALGTFTLPPMRLLACGYGLGARSLPDQPNALRVLIGEVDGEPPSYVVIETNIDDQPAEQLAYVLERVLAAGARDAWFTPIQMKKTRPAIMLSVIAEAAREREIAALILRETTTLGVRVIPVRRHEADRAVQTVETSLGVARVKVKQLAGRTVALAPEFEDCRRIAAERDLPIAEVYRVVERAARELLRDARPSS